MRRTLGLGALILTGSCSWALAQGASPQTGITIFNKGSFVAHTSIFGRSGGLLSDGARVVDPLGRRGFTYAAPFTFGYGITKDFQFMINAPLLHRASGSDTAPPGPRVVNENSGVGDITLLLKYRFYKNDRFDPEKEQSKGSTQLAFTAGPKLPTGETEAKEATGRRYPPSFQIGSGSTDWFFALGFTNTFAAPESDVWSLKRWQVTASATYLYRTEGAQDFQFPSLLELRGSVNFRPYQARYPGPEWWVFPVVSLELSPKARSRGVPQPNSGGNVLFVGWLTQYSPAPRWTFSGGMDFPVVKELNGTQLAPGPRFHLGVTHMFTWRRGPY